MNEFLDGARRAWDSAYAARDHGIQTMESSKNIRACDPSSPIARLAPSLELPPELVDLRGVAAHETLHVRFPDLAPTTDFRIELLTPRAARGVAIPSASQVLRVLKDYLHLVRALRPGMHHSEPRMLLGFFWNDAPRRLDIGTPGSALGARHVNGGLCWKMHDLVFVYRIQEWRKVLLHELFHFYGLDDFRVDPNTIRSISAEYRVRSKRPLLLQEAYTEALTTIYYVSYCAYQPGISPARFRRAWLGGMDAAKRHAFTVAALLFLHFRESDGWYETTNAFAYYVCKAAFLRDTETMETFLRIVNSRKDADAFASEALLRERTALVNAIAERAPQAFGSSSLAMLPESLVPPS